MRYIIYSRVSTDMQDTSMQNELCINYYNSNKKDKDEVIHFEEGEISTRLEVEERVKLQEMLGFCKKNDTVVVYSLDRLARKGKELVDVYDHLSKKGARIVSMLQPNVDEDNIHLYAYFGQMERKFISRRTKDNLKAKQNRMEKVGTTWYGFKTDPNILQTERKRARSFEKPFKLIPDDKEYQASLLMIQWHSEGLSYQQIADELSGQGYTNRAGKPFQKMTVYRVLQRKERYSQVHVV